MTFSFEPGEIIDGQYQLETEIDAGGFARVWRATDTQSGTPVAIKKPNFNSGNSNTIITKYFERETELLEAIRSLGGHQGIVRYIASGTVNDFPYLVTEYIDGQVLDEFIQSEGVVTDEQTLRRIGIEICNIVSFCHEAEIIHRDLKPNNLMITEQGDLRLIDFNAGNMWAALRDDYTYTDDTESEWDTILRGPFKPPEVMQPNVDEMRQGPWSDVYSLGKLLVFLLTGHGPSGDNITLDRFDTNMPNYIEEVITRATGTDFRQRYSNARAMEVALDNRGAETIPEARVQFLANGNEVDVSPGDTVGQDSPDANPSIAVRDQDGYISDVHLVFDYVDGHWIVTDRSVNGTWVQSEGEWYELRDPNQVRRLEEEGYDLDISPDASESVPVSNGDLIAPVAPDYGATFEFRI